MRSMKRLAFVFALLLCVRAPAQAQSGAEPAFQAYAQASRAYDTAKMTELMHPEALERFRRAVDSVLHGPKSDAAQAELLPLFAVSTVDEFTKLSDAEAYERMNQTIAKASPQIVELMSTAEYVVVGSFIKEGVAYVTYNLTLNIEGKAASTQVVQTLKGYNGAWRLLLPPSAETTISRMTARYQ